MLIDSEGRRDVCCQASLRPRARSPPTTSSSTYGNRSLAARQRVPLPTYTTDRTSPSKRLAGEISKFV